MKYISLSFYTTLIGLITFTLLAPKAFSHPPLHTKIDLQSFDIAKNPYDQMLYINRSLSYLDKEKLNLALADLNTAEKIGPPINAAYAFALYHLAKGDLKHSLEHLNEYLGHFNEFMPAIELRGEVYRKLGEYKKSIEDYRTILAMHKHPAPGHYIAIAEMYETLGGDNLRKAIDTLNEGLKNLHSPPQLQRCAIKLDIKLGQFDSAIARIDTLKPKIGKTPEWKKDKADILQAGGNLVEAKRYYHLAYSQLTDNKNKIRMTKSRARLKETLKEKISEI